MFHIHVFLSPVLLFDCLPRSQTLAPSSRSPHTQLLPPFSFCINSSLHCFCPRTETRMHNRTRDRIWNSGVLQPHVPPSYWCKNLRIEPVNFFFNEIDMIYGTYSTESMSRPKEDWGKAICWLGQRDMLTYKLCSLNKFVLAQPFGD